MAALDIVVILLAVAGVVLLVPSTVLLVQVLASLLPERKPRAGEGREGPGPRLAVIVPAHDEALMIGEALGNIRAQLLEGDRLLVVADNCTDATADIAASLGAEVVTRTDPNLRGKAYALAFGISHLARNDPPDVVMVIDADCTPGPGLIQTVARKVFETGQPVQPHYELYAPRGHRSLGLAMAVFAFQVKNVVRGTGLARLGLPCQLMGAGAALPWPALERVRADNGALAEDFWFGLDLAQAGYLVQFCPSARLTSPFPASEEGRTTQRERWEAGHLAAIWKRVPGLMAQAVRERNPRLFALALDMAVPPLAFHALLLSGLFAASLLVWLLGGAVLPLALSAVGVAFLAVSIFLAWRQIGKDNLSFSELAQAPLYMLSKIPLYFNIFRGKPIFWLRSKRD